MQQAARFGARQSGSGRRAHAAARLPSESAPFRSRVGSQATMAAYPTFSPVSNAVRSVSCSEGTAFPSLRAARGASSRAASCACAEGFPCVSCACVNGFPCVFVSAFATVIPPWMARSASVPDAGAPARARAPHAASRPALACRARPRVASRARIPRVRAPCRAKRRLRPPL